MRHSIGHFSVEIETDYNAMHEKLIRARVYDEAGEPYLFISSASADVVDDEFTSIFGRHNHISQLIREA